MRVKVETKVDELSKMTKIIDKGMNTEEKLNIIQNLDLYIFLIIHLLSLFLHSGCTCDL